MLKKELKTSQKQQNLKRLKYLIQLQPKDKIKGSIKDLSKSIEKINKLIQSHAPKDYNKEKKILLRKRTKSRGGSSGFIPKENNILNCIPKDFDKLPEQKKIDYLKECGLTGDDFLEYVMVTCPRLMRKLKNIDVVDIV